MQRRSTLLALVALLLSVPAVQAAEEGPVRDGMAVNRLPTLAATLARVQHALDTNGGDYWATYNFERGLGCTPVDAARIAQLAVAFRDAGVAGELGRNRSRNS